MTVALSAALLLGLSAGVSAQQNDATVSFEEQAIDGQSVVVDEVTLPNGGFVIIHDSKLADGDVLGSVVGSSAYLESGTHQDVEVPLDEPVEDDEELTAMPHFDTNGDEEYDFVDTGGQEDGPYVFERVAVTDSARVTVNSYVNFEDQTVQNGAVSVDTVTLSNGGFVTVHDSTLVTANDPIGSVLGTSGYLDPGTHDGVIVGIGEDDTGTMYAMPHKDTNGNKVYDFVDTGGSEDGPYTASGRPVVAAADITADEPETVNVTIDNAGASAWEFVNQEEDVANTGEDNPNMELEVGKRYEFENRGWSGHPFQILDIDGNELLSQNSGGTLESDSLVNWEDNGDTFSFTVSRSLADEIDSYRCGIHTASMQGDMEATQGVSNKYLDGNGDVALSGLQIAIRDFISDSLTLSELQAVIQAFIAS